MSEAKCNLGEGNLADVGGVHRPGPVDARVELLRGRIGAGRRGEGRHGRGGAPWHRHSAWGSARSSAIREGEQVGLAAAERGQLGDQTYGGGHGNYLSLSRSLSV